LTLEVTETGLEMRAILPDTEQGKAVYAAVQRGDLSQMSFAFDIGTHEFDQKTQTRTITAISKVYEISVVNHAAYTQTTVQARAGKDDIDMNTFNPITSAVFDDTKGYQFDTPHAAPEYRSAFFKNLLGQSLTEAETRAYNAARAEKRADAFNTLSNSAAVVPETTLNEVIKGLHPLGGLYDEIRMFSVPANMSIPVGTPTDPAQWHVEGAPVDRNNITTHNVTFAAFELIKVLSLSAAAKRMTLSAFEAYLTDELRKSITDALNAAIINGTGAGQPQGLLTGITWDASNTITSTTNIIDSVLKTIAKLPAGYANGAKFAMSNATLFTAIYPAKTADGAYILMPDVQNGSVRRLFGYEIVVDDNLPADTIIFGNFKYYGINVPSGIAVETSRDSGFTSGLIDFRALCIADAKPIVPAAFVKLAIS
jgi:HK97 family phage major capsid protein